MKKLVLSALLLCAGIFAVQSLSAQDQKKEKKAKTECAQKAECKKDSTHCDKKCPEKKEMKKEMKKEGQKRMDQSKKMMKDSSAQ